PFLFCGCPGGPVEALYSTKQKAAVKAAMRKLWNCSGLELEQEPVNGHRPERERGDETDAAVATEAAVGLEVQIADDVVAAAAPHPVRARLVHHVRIEDPQQKREKRPYHYAQGHAASSLDGTVL